MLLALAVAGARITTAYPSCTGTLGTCNDHDGQATACTSVYQKDTDGTLTGGPAGAVYQCKYLSGSCLPVDQCTASSAPSPPHVFSDSNFLVPSEECDLSYDGLEALSTEPTKTCADRDFATCDGFVEISQSSDPTLRVVKKCEQESDGNGNDGCVASDSECTLPCLGFQVDSCDDRPQNPFPFLSDPVAYDTLLGTDASDTKITCGNFYEKYEDESDQSRNVYVRCTESPTTNFCDDRKSLVGFTDSHMSNPEKGLMQALPTYCTKPPPLACVGPKAILESGSDIDGDCRLVENYRRVDSLIEGFYANPPILRDSDTVSTSLQRFLGHTTQTKKRFGTGGSFTHYIHYDLLVHNQIVCTGPAPVRLGVNCMDEDHNGVKQYCLPDCETIVESCEGLTERDITGKSCNQYAEQINPFLDPDIDQDFFYESGFDGIAPAWHRRCQPNSVETGTPCVDAANWDPDNSLNGNPSMCLAPRPPKFSNERTADGTYECRAENDKYTVRVETLTRQKQLLPTYAYHAYNSRVDAPVLYSDAAKCCTDASGKDCYGNEFTEDDKKTFDHPQGMDSYACCSYSDPLSQVVCTSSSSVGCAGLYDERRLNEQIQDLISIQRRNYLQSDVFSEWPGLNARLTEEFDSLNLENVCRVPGVTESIQTGNIAGIRRAVDLLQHTINIMSQTSHQFDEFMNFEVFGQSSVNSPSLYDPLRLRIRGPEYQSKVQETMQNFAARVDDNSDVLEWFNQPEQNFQQLYDYHAIPCLNRANRNLCENYFVFHKRVEGAVENANVKHCVWTEDSQNANGGTCSMGQNCDFEYE